MNHDSRHFAVIAPPTPGHLNPLQVLGADLVSKGNRVTIVHVGPAARFVTNGTIGFTALPKSAGETEAFDAYLGKLAHATGPVGTGRMIRATAALSVALLDDAPAVIERIGADVIIADAAEAAGPLIAQRLDLPCVISVTGLPLLREEGVPPPFLGWRYNPDPLGCFRNRGGYAVSDLLMRPVTSVLDDRRRAWGLRQAEEEPCVQVAQCPPGLDYPRKELPREFHYGSPWRSSAEFDVSLPNGRPLIYCSLGTLQRGRWDLFAKMAQACAAIGARAVIGHGGALTPAEAAVLPGEPLVRAFWPQGAVLRQCVAAVLHGGFNTVLDALAAGIPIVALPIAFEQSATAARLAWSGAGIVLSPRLSSVGMLSRALAKVMNDPSYQQAAARLRAEIESAGGVAVAADRIRLSVGLCPADTVALAA